MGVIKSRKYRFWKLHKNIFMTKLTIESNILYIVHFRICKVIQINESILIKKIFDM